MINFGKLKYMPDYEIRKCCQDFQIVLTDVIDGEENKDIEAIDLFQEILIVREIVEENLTALQTLSLLKKTHGSFPNTEIAIRVLLTIPVTSAGAERSFSKLKIIKNYLRNSLSQYKLTNLALIAIENDIADQVNMDDFIDSFAAQKTRKNNFNLHNFIFVLFLTFEKLRNTYI